ncbi:dihydrolipoyl dehydrogenase [Candidatus Marsarchaeota G2 archaeon ECH_B_SAG-F08]|jgi:dihydrolipoamide dehydrogenase|uniref:Dihydrolipoyl dehydrogenase n=6 Tax=Candidatus Marsarchaeota TaxID=1978152 RepID=A0A2R6AJL2_9ARCH|nr:MAG: dihydrolipoyl dehydrogenase [Candidatus Marsarchaeota G1 archaeon OSP_D]PSN86539.1 MAG: dihydrolipoyl dehydrogenase [Candidatus Marsarchaeota G1 archaeon BE_D]PSN89211.1 MAG: dihydrolipoyl dehydrogenase [Candidatus Marsarchaeota G1 archaeon OSP_C]PSN92803.1 MAG: dihydrolipoyl dehydrogenase [Candidatus Marsarchaeota G1 archaeon OSP_B]PSN98048.1 MAG: dihydrolipoyl dehydrogenase [Candidatus Marsarchaeota G2 archaeon ECH_B_SAG-F08]PSO05317.1 MAG: dihydrolipoyl dehydrogenase [Candidatus Mar
MDYECVVIGGGPGGYVAAIRLGQLGKKVALIEKNRVGGECLNYGCIPTKTIINAVKLAEKVKSMAGRGVNAQLSLNLKELKQWKNQVVTQLVRGVENLLKSNKVELIYGEASFVDTNTIQVKLKDGSTREIKTQNSVIATGSVPIELPGFPIDHTNILSNWDMLELEDIPSRLLVIGGGVVGMEFAFAFSKLGSKVTVVELMDQLLPGQDKEVSALLYESAISHGMEIYLKSKALSWTKENGTLKVKVFTQEGEVEKECDKILLSVGRKPYTKGLGLENIGVKTDEKGFIIVDDCLKTNIENIYAIGDVVRGPMLAHKASRQGVVVAEVIAGLSSRFDNVVIPDATFTDPEIASVGHTVESATKAGYEVIVGKFPFVALGRAVSVAETKGFVKIIAEKSSGVILGAQIVGANASDLISELSLAIEMGATLEDLSSTIHPHPTFPEALMEAAEAAQGKAIHVVNRPWRK